MKKSRFVVLVSLAVCTVPMGCFASTINLGSIATNNIAVFGFDSPLTSSSVLVTNIQSSHINITGDVVSPVVSNAAGLHYNSGSTVTSGTELTNAETAFASVISQLALLSYSSLTITSGVTNNLSTPGDYLINGVLGAGTVINITAPGKYNFKTTGNLTLTSVTINALNSGLSSDDIFWYTTGVASITNSTVFGDVVQSGASNDLLQTSGGLTGNLTGRFLSGGFFTSLTAAQASTLNINNHGNGVGGGPTVPEPTTFAFFAIGLGMTGLSLKVRRRR